MREMSSSRRERLTGRNTSRRLEPQFLTFHFAFLWDSKRKRLRMLGRGMRLSAIGVNC